MKIVGVTYYDGCENLVLKSDSSMLVNRKPLFVPDAVCDLQALPCWVLRVSRLGRCIAPRFASRYYNAVAPGIDFFAADLLRRAKAEARPWTEAVAFEGSLAVGTWLPAPAGRWEILRDGERLNGTQANAIDCSPLFDSVIARVSDMLTIRQGDLIYVAANRTPLHLQREDVIRCAAGEQEHLYCKIK